MEHTEEKQKQAELSQDSAPVQGGGQTAAEPDPQVQNAQKTQNAPQQQGVDLAHGNTSELIARGESMTDGNDPYTAMNYYVPEYDDPLSAYFGKINGRFITEYSFGELDALSPEQGYVNMTISYTDGDPDRNVNASLFALGKYQMVPSVRMSAMACVGLSESAPFSPQNQDLCFTNYLIVEKRPAVMAYLSGESDDIEEAALEIAMEWAAVGISPNETTARGEYGSYDGLTSYYNGVGDNAASVSYEEIKAALCADRAAIESGGIASHTAVTSMNTPESIYPSDHTAPQANQASESNAAEPVSTNIDIDTAVTFNRMYGYTPDTWVEIQRGIGMPEYEVDGDVGPVTSQAIANWQASRGFPSSDVDGICGPMTLDAIRSGMPAVSAAIAQDPAVQQAAQPETPAPAPTQTDAPAQQPAPAPAPTQTQPADAALLSPDEVQTALDWNIARDYAPETIMLIQSSIGAPQTGSFCAADIQKIAAWQKLYGLPEIDGMFGNQAMRVSTIKPKFNHALYHYLGSDTPAWCDQHGFITSASIDDLQGDFRESARKVVEGIRAAGGDVGVNVTFRHHVRAAIMNFCVELNKSKVEGVFAEHGVDVDGDWSGAAAARDAFGLGNNPAAVFSNHIYGLAIDMYIDYLPDQFVCGSEVVYTGGNQGDWVANAAELDRCLRNYAIGDNFHWFGYGDTIHWSYNGG
ncbi:MAG: peptidoglycan-binding protein [Proteobacteria bacterium]|nr:peptidoglycan-binding protein [Pseudomonadota bacterium]